ncbi:MAG: peptidoglycan bridge formation glycyltransferase FemA/FemB family protein [Caldilinea sp.]|nr:peptidoglycan bridge formation glycyltransferase FemA/FemB family protein [Caldilinea sp.]MDW8440298.1 peptidoglycan bridge formation glycyltransferase FemA/FemB family protein [Caldilineaceae bacterium]
MEQLERIAVVVEAATWDRWLTQREDGHPLQLSGWGGLKERFGWRAHRIALCDETGAQLRAGAQLLLRSAYSFQLAYIPRGPLVNWQDEEQCAALFGLLENECRRLGASVLKIEPALIDSPANRTLLARCGFRPSRQAIQPSSTILVDLADDETMLAAMKSKWRYNVRLAERKGVIVRAMERSDLPAFHRLMQETGARDGFAVHSDAYFDAAFDLLTPEHATFLVAEYAGEPLAAIVVAVAGKHGVYLWGASSERERGRMPNHALQWAGMRWAREHGASVYDLWGVPDLLGQLATAMAQGCERGVTAEMLPIQLDALPDGGLWGVYRFKQGFGGRVVRTVGAWDKAIHPFAARLYFAGLALKQHKADLRYSVQHASEKRRAPVRSFQHKGVPSFLTQTNASGARYELEQIEEPDRWRAALAQTPSPHVLQSWEWGEVKAQAGWQAERIVVRSSGAAAAFQFLWREPIPHLPLRVAYIPKGPALDWSDVECVNATLSAIEEYTRSKKCVFVKIDPNVREDATAGRLTLHALQRRGWRFSTEQIQFKNTAFTDLRVGEDALLASMKSKWRYNIRLAQKRGVCIRCGEEKDLEAFYALYAETARRDGFLIRSAPYYWTAWRTFLAAQRQPGNPAGGALLLAERSDDPEPVAGLFLLRYGATAWYFYGASSDRHRRDMPNHLLQWEAMRWAIAQGCTTYDWWGAPTRPEDPSDPLHSVWQFKQGFGAELQPHIGAWDYVISPLGYRAITQVLPFARSTMRWAKEFAESGKFVLRRTGSPMERPEH